MNTYQQNLIRAKKIIGSYQKMAAVCGITPKAVNKWYFAGRPPRTEYTGETEYAVLLSKATNGEVSPLDLKPMVSTND